MARKRKKRLIEPISGWAIYLRTSSKNAQNPKTSQERQRRRIQEALIDKYDLPIIEVYSDVESGTDPNRFDYQRMLRDARQGKFSHLAVENAERFGRDDAEALRAMNELEDRKISLRFADYPDLDPTNSDERVLIGMMVSMAQRESKKLAERVRGGQATRLLNGGHLGRVPDGYIHQQEQIPSELRTNVGRVRRWIELDPVQSKVWRHAWDLLLTDRYTLKEICEALHAKGFMKRSGKPFVKSAAPGKRTHATNTLSDAFHNWFYAGYVVSKREAIPPKTLRGRWEPLVSVEEFERGLEILARRSRKRSPRRKHFYLLKKLAHVETDDGVVIRLSGSTPNLKRDTGGNRYYCVPGSGINIPCALVDDQVPEALQTVWVAHEHIDVLRAAYREEIDMLQSDPTEDIRRVENALATISKRKRRIFELYAQGVYGDVELAELHADLEAEHKDLRRRLALLNQYRQQVVSNLDDALEIVTRLADLYGTLTPDKQQRVLNEIVNRFVVDESGILLRLELHPPFAYLASKYGEVKKRLAINDTKQNATPKRGGIRYKSRSEYVRKGTPGRSCLEPHPPRTKSIGRLLKATEFPQRTKLQNLLKDLSK